MRTSRPPTSAAYETESNVITHIQRETEEGIQESYPISPETKREREKERDFIWVCRKSLASIWPLQLYGTELDEKKEEERKIL